MDRERILWAERGADIQNILSFEKDYPNARIIKLEQNYRSTKNILDASGSLVSKNEARKGKTLWTERTGVLSTQVLQEFYVNVTRKIQSPLSKDLARLVVSSYAIWCVDTTAAEISTAFRIEDESRIGFWDALIIYAAAKSGATRILSEDLNAGQRIAGVLVENPFASRR